MSRSVIGAVIEVPAGVFAMGDAFDEGEPDDREGPVRAVATDAYQMEVTAVTVERFAAFVAVTGWITDAERLGLSAVFEGGVAVDAEVVHRVAAAPWWLAVRGAGWRFPGGGSVPARPEHPVVHVSWSDAVAYASWAGRRLPTESEWERAARGGLAGKRFPWGDDWAPGAANVWADGPGSVEPVGSRPPNAYGLHEVVGNVWEWCADRFDGRPGERVVRGGSYLCHPAHCARYRVAARSSHPADTTADNLGFRCAV